jgi:endonuclease/exonuclease/phosphatase family metal-dependent hydrolase
MARHLSGAGDAPMIVAGDFNDWRHSASDVMSSALGLAEASVMRNGRPARTFPSVLPLLQLDRIYVRGFEVLEAHAHRGAPWRLLSDHIAVSAELGYGDGARIHPR